MPDFHFTAERSKKPEDQLPGMTCDRAIVSGDFTADDETGAWRVVVRALPIPGVWNCHMSCGSRRLIPRRIRRMSGVSQ